ncbi:FmdE family protein [Desulfosoma sp.]|uniref:FmdE family protein n=1 Tax=Desulfosoma sp. TaxID=2603217 RepID=UPI00404A7D5E
MRKTTFNVFVVFLLVIMGASFHGMIFPQMAVGADSGDYQKWKSVGSTAAIEGVNRIAVRSMVLPFQRKWIALSNAGYAEPNGQCTIAALDGLSEKLGVSRGAQTLVEVHSAPEKPLWFAIYDAFTGFLAYLQVNPERVEWDISDASNIFSKITVENVKANYIFNNADSFAPDFGGNEFAIVTIANAVAAGVPAYVFRSLEFHDHLCPGLTSGILIGQFAKHYFRALGTGSWFVQGLQPWCKEDALMVMLNATPGKSGYGVIYSTPEERKKWAPYGDAVNIIFHYNPETKLWEGLVVGFQWASQTGCEQFSNNLVKKLCSDLYYLNYLDQPELFVKVLTTLTLKPGVHPKSLRY